MHSASDNVLTEQVHINENCKVHEQIQNRISLVVLLEAHFEEMAAPVKTFHHSIVLMHESCYIDGSCLSLDPHATKQELLNRNCPTARTYTEVTTSLDIIIQPKK